LSRANLSRANLSQADLTDAALDEAILTDADLTSTTLTGASLFYTVFGDVDLSGVIALERCNHLGPSIVDHRTLQKSKLLPLAFLRGVGLPDKLIEYLPSLYG
jgi:uncharacterized protein YjbI with pentapeptide repeats